MQGPAALHIISTQRNLKTMELTLNKEQRQFECKPAYQSFHRVDEFFLPALRGEKKIRHAKSIKKPMACIVGVIKS